MKPWRQALNKRRSRTYLYVSQLLLLCLASAAEDPDLASESMQSVDAYAQSRGGLDERGCAD